MNLLTKKSGLLFLLAALFIFSCKKESSRIGQTLGPPDIETNFTFNDSIVVQTSTVLVNDSIVTSENPFIMVGQLNDPVFGRVTAKTFGQLVYNRTGIDFGTNPVLDSAVFGLIPNAAFGDTNAATLVDQTFSVYQLTSGLDTGVVYRANSPEIPYDLNKKLASFTIAKDKGLGKMVSARLLDEQFAREILTRGIITDTDLLNYCRGIAIVAEDKDALVRRFYLVPPVGSFSGIVIYFHNDKGYSSVTLNLTLAGQRFYTFNTDRSGTPLAALGNQSYQAEIKGPLSYAQGGTGVMTKLSFPGLTNFLNSIKEGERLIINKAEIVIQADQSNNLGYTLNNMALYQTVNGKMKKTSNIPMTVQQNMTDVFGTKNPVIATYDATSHLYKFSIGSYLQAVVDKRIDLQPFLVSAPEQLNFYSLDRTILKNDLNSNTDRIKLNLYYTIVK